MIVSKELTAASATPLILAILQNGDSYGYQIIKDVKFLSQGDIEWTDGMLYPVLHRLEKRGFIESYKEKQENGRMRKYYRILEKGIKELNYRRKSWKKVNLMLERAWETGDLGIETLSAVTP